MTAEDWRLQRLIKVLYVVLMFLGVLLVQYLALQRWLNCLGLVAAAAGLAVALQRARTGRLGEASIWMLWTLTLLVAFMMWTNRGLRDSALLGFPGVLVFAAMLSTRRQFVSLLVFQVGMVALLAWSNVSGWHVHPVGSVQPSILIDIAAILTVTGYGVWLLGEDLRQAMERLREEKERIEFLAHHDALTGLPNRVLARDRMTSIAALSRRRGELAAVLHVDLDNFKTINDSMGHTAGDEFLRLVAGRLRQWIRTSDTLSRPGGDEFLLLLGGFKSRDAVANYVARLVSRMTEPLSLQGLDVPATLSVGVAVFPDDGQDFDDLTKKADMAMYRAKDAGRNTFRFYDPEMNASVVEHLHLASGMRQALAEGHFVLYYQPQVRLADGHVYGGEALIRWRHPELGLIPPARFIPVAEKSGLIVEIGVWVLEEACRQAVAWQRAGWSDFRISVNLSPVQFRHGNLDGVVATALDRSGLAPHCLELEITESVFVDDSPATAEVLARLRGMGVNLSIDDFGTGYSNLGYLKRFEVGCLKIDQSFTRKLLLADDDRAIVSAIIQMARGLRLECVAEGIEDAETLALLREMGCEMGQGFHWSPPVTPEVFYGRFAPGVGSGG